MTIVYRFLPSAMLLATLVFGFLAADTAGAQDRRVRIINASNVTVNSFQASNTTRKSWEEDIPGRSVLRPARV